MPADLTLPDGKKPKPPPIPTSPEAVYKPNRKSFRKTLEGLIPVTPKTAKYYPDGLIPASPKSPATPASIEKGPILRRFTFIPLDIPDDGDRRARRRMLILLWIFGILVILGLSLGLGLGLGMKGLQNNGSSSEAAPTTTMANAQQVVQTSSVPTSASTATSATASATAGGDKGGQVVKVQQFFQPAFAVPADAPTATYTVTAATAASGVGAVDCPSGNGTTYTSNGKKFTKLCYTDLPGPGILNLAQATVNSLEACINECTKYNGSKGSCGAVSYSANLTQIVPQQHANCWLKDKSGEPKPGVWDQASAVLA